jgi:large subunit ribosomal protein L18
MNPRLKMRLKRKRRIRKQLSGTGDRPRLSVFRSARHIYAQIIDDAQGATLVATGTLDTEIRDKLPGLKKQQAAREVGKLLAAKARAKGITQVVFDRNGFLYHGRVKELAEGCREEGLIF